MSGGLQNPVYIFHLYNSTTLSFIDFTHKNSIKI